MQPQQKITADDPPGFYFAATYNAPLEAKPVHWDGSRVVDAWSGEEIPNPVNFRGPLFGPLIKALLATVACWMFAAGCEPIQVEHKAEVNHRVPDKIDINVRFPDRKPRNNSQRR